MNEDEKKQNDTQDISDIEIATLANEELKKRDYEINTLKKELAKSKLYSQVNEEPKMTKNECINIISGGNEISNYEYATAVLRLVDIANENSEPNPLGANGDNVYNFLNMIIAECDGDKSRFVPIYQSKIGADPSNIGLKYKSINK